MPIETRTQLKTYFQTGDKPTQGQFENLIDSAVPFAKTITDTDSPYTVLDSDYTIFVDATGGNTLLNFPLAASFAGRIISVKKIDAGGNDVRLMPSGADNFEGVPGAFIFSTSLFSFLFQSDGVNNWWSIARSQP